MRMRHTGGGGLVAVAAAVAGLSGCAVGNRDFSCPGRPQGVRCASAVDVYNLTGDTDAIAATAADAIGSDPSRATEARAAQSGRVQAATRDAPGQPPVAGHAPMTVPGAPPATVAEEQVLRVSTSGAPVGRLPLVDRPTPVRTPAQVMRVWLAPWEDTRGVLHIGGYHFIEVVGRRWTIGGPVNAEPARVFSINYDDTVSERTPEPGDDGATASEVNAVGSPVFGGIAGQAGSVGN